MDPVTIGLGAAGLFVATATAVANMASAYTQYRANHPRKNQTGRVQNYTACHEGYSLTQHHGPYPAVPLYQAYTNLLPAPPVPPSNQHHSQPSTAAQLAPSTHQPPPKSPSSFGRRKFQTFGSKVNLALGRTNSVHEIPPRQQVPISQRIPRSQSAHPVSTQQHINSLGYHGDGHGPSPLPHGYGGSVVLVKREQRSKDTLPDTKVGMNTGRKPGYTKEDAQAHWSPFRNNSFHDGGTIAVVNWSERVITMYVYFEHSKQFFRNYHVHNCDLEAFGRSYKKNQVFSGIFEESGKDSWLRFCNCDLKIVEDDGHCHVKSTNCWGLLGIQGHIPGGDLVFVEMKRAALFGLLQCRWKDPTLLNVDMVGDEKIQFVHVDTEYNNLATKKSCLFSVFDFATKGWSEGRVLVG